MPGFAENQYQYYITLVAVLEHSHMPDYAANQYQYHITLVVVLEQLLSIWGPIMKHMTASRPQNNQYNHKHLNFSLIASRKKWGNSFISNSGPTPCKSAHMKVT